MDNNLWMVGAVVNTPAPSPRPSESRCNMKHDKQTTKTEFALVFIDDFIFLSIPDRKTKKFYHVAIFDGDPLAYIGVPEEIRKRLKVESATKPKPISSFITDLTKDEKLKKATYRLVTLIGTRDDIKIVNEHLDKFWSIELSVGDVTYEELEEQWNG